MNGLTSLYWVKWKSFDFKLAEDSPDAGFEEMKDMFRYSGDMPRRVHFTPPTKESPSHGWFHVEMVSDSSKQLLEARAFKRWNSFSAFTRFIDYINEPLEFKKYCYNPYETKTLFNSLLAKNDMGMYADW
jgi:hypothetical protein